MDTTTAKSAASPQPYQKFKSGVDSVANKVADKVEGFDLQEQYGMIKEKAEDIYDTSVSFIKKYPVSSLLGATAVGFLAAALLRRND